MMKKILFLLILCAFTGNVFSQAYKKTNLLDKHITFSHLQLLDGENGVDRDLFEMRGRKTYSEDKTSSSYEVVYFKGNAKEMYAFFCSLMELSKKIGKNDVVAYISGIRVETLKGRLGFRVYDDKEGVYCYYTMKQWGEILKTFIIYCDENKITY